MLVFVFRVRMQMRMGVRDRPMGMPVRVHEIGPQQQFVIRQNLRWRAARADLPFLQHNNPRRDVLHDLQLMGRCDHGF